MPTNKNVFVVPNMELKQMQAKMFRDNTSKCRIADTLPKTVPIFFICLVINFIVNGTMALKTHRDYHQN